MDDDEISMASVGEISIPSVKGVEISLLSVEYTETVIGLIKDAVTSPIPDISAEISLFSVDVVETSIAAVEGEEIWLASDEEGERVSTVGHAVDSTRERLRL